MAKNIKHTRNSNVALALPVPAGTVGGDVVLLGSAGLRGVAINDRATTALINEGKAAPGLANGEASVELQGVGTVVELDIAEAATQFDAIYKEGAEYNKDSANGVKIGYILKTLAAPGRAKVALIGS